MHMQKVIFELIVKYFLCKSLKYILAECWDNAGTVLQANIEPVELVNKEQNMQCFLLVYCALVESCRPYHIDLLFRK